LSDDFEIEGAKPIKAKVRVLPVSGKKFDANNVRKRQAKEACNIENYAPTAVYTNKSYAFLVPDDLSGLDKNLQEKFKNGEIAIQMRLDMHGMTVEEAFKEFTNFMRKATVENKRKLLIVTGKGGTAPKIGALKQNLPNWLNMPEFRHFLLAYTNATPRHGGQGAWYVLLRNPQKIS
jgi:DNA-nicking Smr family endonuclease